ncbi:MAG TPA: hypothetical protein VFA98_01970 [Thermoanaerobaculia bacterium]|nr:hypothetical protein [Thermoanaerobaculia bacterium]
MTAAKAVFGTQGDLMTKKKTTGSPARDHSKPDSRQDRRTTGDRRADDRRAHARFSPADARTDRRQGERRGPRS